VNGELPLVFGRTAGKDRAEISAALVLNALGVPRQLIFEDYLLSQQFAEQDVSIDRRQIKRDYLCQGRPGRVATAVGCRRRLPAGHV
jgi:protein-tyrosine phosphatase